MNQPNQIDAAGSLGQSPVASVNPNQTNISDANQPNFSQTNRKVAIAFIIWQGLLLLFLIFPLIVNLGQVGSEAAPIGFIILYLFLIAIFIASLRLLAAKKWAMWSMFTASCVYLFGFPILTVVGILAIIFFSKNKQSYLNGF